MITKQLNKDRTKEMYRMYTDGATLQEIGEKYGLSRARIHQLFLQHGLQIQTRATVWNKKYKILINEYSEAVFECVEQGYSIPKIAKTVGCTENLVKEILSGKGILEKYSENYVINARHTAKKKFSDEDILEHLKHAYNICGRETLTVEQYTHEYQKVYEAPSAMLILSRFGWNNALRLAGLPTNLDGKSKEHYNRDELLVGLRRVAKVKKGLPSPSDYERLRKSNEPTYATIKMRLHKEDGNGERYFTWREILELAGLQVSIKIPKK